MNIHIKDIELFEKLKSASLLKVEVGSTMYNLNDSNSDTDYLYIYATSDNEINSFLNTHHQIQYKEENIDHNFVSLHTFIRNAISGDSTINFEVINSDKLIGTDLEFLYNMKNSFSNYAIIRSYLGMARRDANHYGKCSTHRDQLKKIIHIYRGYYFANSIMDKNFSLINNDLINISKEVKSIDEKEYKVKKEYLRQSLCLISELREELNEKLNNNTLYFSKNMNVKSAEVLDRNIFNLMKSDKYNRKKDILNNFDMSLFYNAFENWVEY